MSDIHDKDRQLYTISDLLEWKPPYHTHIISSGILNTKNRMIIFGDEGSWKSILAVHTGHCIARGSDWLGFRTYPSNVLRVQVELPMYIDRERLDKYCTSSKKIYLARDGRTDILPAQADELDMKANMYAYPENYISRTEQFMHIDESIGWESLLRNIRLLISELPNIPLVVILDPLYKMFSRDINEETDVKPLLDKVDLIMEDVKESAGISFIIVHHTRKSKTDESGVPIAMGSQDATGSRAWMRWADTILRIDPDINDKTMTRITATFTKHRNAESVLPTIRIKWDRDTLHPHILQRIFPKYEDEGEVSERGELGLAQLE